MIGRGKGEGERWRAVVSCREGDRGKGEGGRTSDRESGIGGRRARARGKGSGIGRVIGSGKGEGLRKGVRWLMADGWRPASAQGKPLESCGELSRGRKGSGKGSEGGRDQRIPRLNNSESDRTLPEGVGRTAGTSILS